MYTVNVSSIQDFMQCRFRWWCKWVMNRVPVVESPALDAGRLLHRIFEEHFTSGISLVQAANEQCASYRLIVPTCHPAAQPNAYKALQVIEDLIEAFPLWQDTFPISEVLEVEQPFEWEQYGILWRGRPDRVVVSGKGRIWHEQNRGLAASMNFGTYTRLAKRHYHEHLYAEFLSSKYCSRKAQRSSARTRPLVVGGTVFNLVRKLKYRTNVGKKNEQTKTAAEMFNQQILSIDLRGKHHEAVMLAMRQHVHEMIRTETLWNENSVIPAPNEKMNGGFSGSSEDPYFKVLIGEISLEDDTVFKDREDTYAVVDPSE